MIDNLVMKERSLVVFTLLNHLAIGSFWMLGIFQWWASGRVESATVVELTSGSYLAIIPLMVLALLISLLHLGAPLNAWRAVANLRTSWLSREIIFVLLFTLLEAVFAFTYWQQLGKDLLRLLLWSATTLVSILVLYSMTRLYMLRAITSWNNWTTPVSFIISTLLLGGLGAGFSLALNSEARGELVRLPLMWISLLTLFLLSAQMVLTALRRPPTWFSQATTLLIVRMSLLAFALIVNSFLLYQCVMFEFSGHSATIGWLAMLTFLATLAEQVVGRYLFYVSFERIGI